MKEILHVLCIHTCQLSITLNCRHKHICSNCSKFHVFIFLAYTLYSAYQYLSIKYKYAILAQRQFYVIITLIIDIFHAIVLVNAYNSMKLSVNHIHHFVSSCSLVHNFHMWTFCTHDWWVLERVQHEICVTIFFIFYSFIRKYTYTYTRTVIHSLYR